LKAGLVLLPGLDGTGLLFRPLLEALPPDIHATVIAYPTDETLDLAALAALVRRKLPGENAIVLAESFSGLVALTLLAEGAARIQGVIFVGAFAEPPRPFLLRFAPLASRAPALMRSAPSFLLRQYCLGKDATAAQLNLLREALAAVSPRVLAQRLALVATRHSFGKAPFDVPARYLRASEDRLVPASCSKWFQQRFRKCAEHEIEGPHFVLQARPAESARSIATMVSEIKR
jgi:pimeloyl-[acyl-carrier protein] methyl ester esterase